MNVLEIRTSAVFWWIRHGSKSHSPMAVEFSHLFCKIKERLRESKHDFSDEKRESTLMQN